MTRARAAVVVVHYGELDATFRCLTSLAADPSDVARSVVVVDNQGNVGKEALPDDVILVSRPDNPGFGAGVNMGWDAAVSLHEPNFVVALNNDTEVASGFLEAAANALETGVGAAGGPIRDSDSGRLWYAGGGINFLTGTVRQQRSRRAARRARDVGFIPATAVAVAAPAWREVGGFDPRFFLYNEDLDLCLRLRRAGWRLRFEPRMACDHRLGGSTGSAERSPLYLEHLTRTRLLPFQSVVFRLYLAAIHSVYNLGRVAGLTFRHGVKVGRYASALARGHSTAIRTLFSEP